MTLKATITATALAIGVLLAGSPAPATAAPGTATIQRPTRPCKDPVDTNCVRTRRDGKLVWRWTDDGMFCTYGYFRERPWCETYWPFRHPVIGA